MDPRVRLARRLVAQVDEVKGKIGEALREHLAVGDPQPQLTELVRDVPLDLGVRDLIRQHWDRDEVHQLFDSLQFRVLRDRLYETLRTAEPEAAEGFEVSVVRSGPTRWPASWPNTPGAPPARAVRGRHLGPGTGTITGLRGRGGR